MDEVYFEADPHTRREQLFSFADGDVDMEEDDMDPDEVPKALDDAALEGLYTTSTHLFDVKMQHVPQCIPRSLASSPSGLTPTAP
jgi:hypothetical protein